MSGLYEYIRTRRPSQPDPVLTEEQFREFLYAAFGGRRCRNLGKEVLEELISPKALRGKK